MVDVIAFLSLPDDWAKIAGKKGERVVAVTRVPRPFSRALVEKSASAALPSIEPMACIWRRFALSRTSERNAETARSISTWKGRAFMSFSNGHAKRSEKGLLTQDNCVVALIDHQPQMLFGVSSFRSSVDHQQIPSRWRSHPSVRCARRPHNGRDPELQWKYLAADPRSVSDADAHRTVVHERVGRPELRDRDQRDRSKKIVLAGSGPNVRRPSDGAGDPRTAMRLCRGGLLRRRQPARSRQCDEASDPGGREARHVAVRSMLEWQRDWAQKEHLRRGHGHREDSLRGVRHRRRVRLHDGAQGSADGVSPVRDALAH